MPKRNPTKMGTGKQVRKMGSGWRKKAEGLFFHEGKSIVEMEKELKISRKTLSGFLRGCPGYQEERERRKQEHEALRPAYKREWDRKHRPFSAGAVTGETMRREHDLAALELSRERYR